MLYEIFTVGKIRLETSLKSHVLPPPNPSPQCNFVSKISNTEWKHNQLSRIHREEDSAFTRPFTFTALEERVQKNQESDTLNISYAFTALPVLSCLAILIVNSPSLRYNENHSARTQNAITTFF